VERLKLFSLFLLDFTTRHFSNVEFFHLTY
jgi:hypothetical protein